MSLFVGIEREAAVFKQKKKISLNMWHTGRLPVTEFLSNFHGKTFTIPKTEDIYSGRGSKLHADFDLFEIASPPEVIKQSFSSRVADTLHRDLNAVVEGTAQYQITGYSTHLNVTTIEDSVTPQADIEQGMHPLISLLFKTPLSYSDIHVGRSENRPALEICGDGQMTRDQLVASTLILTSYMSHASKSKPPLLPVDYGKDIATPHGFHNRNDVIAVVDDDGNKSLMTKQVYLQTICDWMSESINSLGSSHEVQVANNYVFGRRKLESDKTDFYNEVVKGGSYTEGIYNPVTAKGESTILGKSQINQSQPVNPLGTLVELHGKTIELSNISWNKVEYSPLPNAANKKPDAVIVEGIQNIYDHVSNLLK